MIRNQYTDEFLCYPLKRVTACIGSAVHGFVFEFANGCRAGTVLANNQKEMGLSDTAIQSRSGINSRWVNVPSGDEIIRVTGNNLVHQLYLCHSITLEMRSGNNISFRSHHEGWRGEEYSFDVPLRPGILRAINFGQGGVRGLDFVETTLHLPIRKDLVPTYPAPLQSFIHKLVASCADIPEEVWFSRIFPAMIGAELMEKIIKDREESNLVQRMISATL